jgi:hypothetical protein
MAAAVAAVMLAAAAAAIWAAAIWAAATLGAEVAVGVAWACSSADAADAADARMRILLDMEPGLGPLDLRLLT